MDLSTTTQAYPKDPSMDISYYISQWFISIAFVIGVGANTSVIGLVVTVKKLRNTSVVFIAMICWANIMTLMLIVPFEVGLFPMVSNFTFHRIHIFGTFCSCALSIFSLTLLTYDRYRIISSPLNVARSYPPSPAYKLVPVFVAAFLVSIPNYFYLLPDNDNEGNLRTAHLPYINTFSTLTLYVIPLLIIGVLCIKMAVRLHHKVRHNSVNHRNSLRQHRVRVQTARVLLCIATTFAGCWLPFYVTLMASGFHQESAFLIFLNKWKVTTLLLNTIFDPMFIYLLGSRLRFHLWQCLKSIARCRICSSPYVS